MLDATAKKLCRLLEPDHPGAVRTAAARVLGELGVREPEVAQALCGLLDDAEPEVRSEAIVAVGKLRLEQALPRLLHKITEGGNESELAAQAAARLGAKGTQALKDLMGHVAPGLRRRIAGAMGAAGTAAAGSAAVDSLLDSDPGVVDAAVRSLITEVHSLTAAQRRGLADHLLDLLKKNRKAGLPPASETAVVRLLGALEEPRAEAFFWERTEPGRPPELRAAALQAAGRVAPSPGKEGLKHLFVCAADPDFRVAAPALLLLRPLTVTERNLPDWLGLLDAPDAAVRRLGMEKVGERDSPAVAEALVRQLKHPDRGLRDEALARLGRLKSGRAVLAEALLNAETPDDAWGLARTLAPLVREFSEKQREEVFERACDYLEAGDRRADALLHVLRDADARELRDRLEERALALRKKKQYPRALVYLRLLGRDPACGPELRFELAACGLKVSGHDLAPDARAADPSLQQFGHLLHSHEGEVLGYVQKAKWLEPEDLFYLGFHFAEKERQEKQFGGEVLKLVVSRSPRTKFGRDARSKLKRESLA